MFVFPEEGIIFLVTYNQDMYIVHHSNENTITDEIICLRFIEETEVPSYFSYKFTICLVFKFPNRRF